MALQIAAAALLLPATARWDGLGFLDWSRDPLQLDFGHLLYIPLLRVSGQLLAPLPAPGLRCVEARAQDLGIAAEPTNLVEDKRFELAGRHAAVLAAVRAPSQGLATHEVAVSDAPLLRVVVGARRPGEAGADDCDLHLLGEPCVGVGGPGVVGQRVPGGQPDGCPGYGPVKARRRQRVRYDDKHLPQGPSGEPPGPCGGTAGGVRPLGETPGRPKVMDAQAPDQAHGDADAL